MCHCILLAISYLTRFRTTTGSISLINFGPVALTCCFVSDHGDRLLNRSKNFMYRKPNKSRTAIKCKKIM